MVVVRRAQFDKLVKAGLIKFGKYDKNFTTINRQKKSKRKKYAVVESRAIMKVLREDGFKK